MKKILLLIAVVMSQIVQAQNTTYQAEEEKINNLIHTKLKVDFDFEKKQMNGEAWIDLSPHFYPTNTVTLDAKAFSILEVKVNNEQPTSFNYSDNELSIALDKTYNRDETYQVYVKYIAKPEDVTQPGSKSVIAAKGLYFIDPLDVDPEKPTQIWTQGETEASSCWFPTIDTPNQKTSQEIYMTVPDRFVTLSNGTMVSSTKNTNGTRTDYWKMDEKHAPYLFFMGVGDFSVVTDTWNGKEVSYYVEKEYENVAKAIFGHTPEMMTFFSDLLDYPYPWDKYSQIVVRDYVSGAMENTTAVVHGEDAQQYQGQLVDENIWEGTIAHELFHHWFGDLVTTESWANLTLNESFATYSVYLWYAYKYGKDKADAHMYEDIQIYKQGKGSAKKLVRFNYADKEDMFDEVSYHKGSAILHMLRDILGDEAFFEGLRLYLKKHEYGTAEAQELRLALEAVSGRDLNWFFNQWYYGSGHIRLNVSYDYNTISKTVTINLKQIGNIFKFPITIDVYEDKGRKTSHEIWVTEEDNSYTLSFERLPKLINIDAKNILLADINDTKTVNNYIFQYKNTTHFADRLEAVNEVAKHQQNSREAFNTMVLALNDPFYKIRLKALEQLDLFQKYNKRDVINKIEQLARNDASTLVRAEALTVLGKLIEPAYKPLFEEAFQSESFSIKGKALLSLYQIDKQASLEKINKLDKRVEKHLSASITSIYITEQDKTKLPYIAKNVLQGMFLTDDERQQQVYGEAFKWIAESDSEEAIQYLCNDFVDFGKKYKEYKFDEMAINLMNQMVLAQQQVNHPNKNEIVLIIKSAMAELIN